MESNDMEQLFKEMLGVYENQLNGLKAMQPPIKMLAQYGSEAQQWLDKLRARYDNEDEICLNECSSLIKQDAIDIWHKATWHGKFDKYLYLSLCYYRIAMFEQFHHRLSEACRHLLDAHHYCGIWIGARYRLDWITHSEKKQMERTEKARQAGLKRGEKLFGPVKAEAIRLLKAKMPKNRWIDATEAFVSIDDELWSFIKAQTKVGEEPTLIYDELERTVLRWIAEDENVKAAFREGLIS